MVAVINLVVSLTVLVDDQPSILCMIISDDVSKRGRERDSNLLAGAKYELCTIFVRSFIRQAKDLRVSYNPKACSHTLSFLFPHSDYELRTSSQ